MESYTAIAVLNLYAYLAKINLIPKAFLMIPTLLKQVDSSCKKKYVKMWKSAEIELKKRD
jgi:hypothetical protein